MQVTVFVALLVLDTKRMEQQRLDCAPCVRVPMLDTQGHWVYPDLSEDEGDEDLEGVYYPPQSQLLDSLGGHSSGAEDDYVPVAAAGPGGGGRGGGHPRFGEVHIPGERPSLQLLLQTYMERLHAPLLMKPLVQVLVLALFTTSLFVSLAVIPRLSVGLDQAVALPRDSYLQNYYRTVMDQLRVGPPLFLVVRGLNMDPAAADINTVCSISGCRKDSLLTRVSGPGSCTCVAGAGGRLGRPSAPAGS
jgi:Niemann-Pick C1 protein